MKKVESEEELLIRVSNEVASKYFINGFEHSDLAQEAFILALDILKKYSPAKGRLENFMRVSLNNAMKNFINARTVDKKLCGCENGTFCKTCRYKEGKARVLSTLQFPADIEFSKNTSIKDSFVDLLPLIDQKLPLSMRTDWRKILDDAHVVKSRKEEIFEEIREIVKDFEKSENLEENREEIEFGWENGYFFLETEEHLAKLYMDEEAANLWLHVLCPQARQVYIRLRECGTVDYNEITILAKSIDDTNSWDV